jgi:hypothetical protein
LLTQLPVHRAVMVGRLFICIKERQRPALAEPAQDRFVARSLAAYGKSSTQFTQDDKRQPYCIGQFDRRNHGCVAPAEIGVTVDIQRETLPELLRIKRRRGNTK